MLHDATWFWYRTWTFYALAFCIFFEQNGHIVGEKVWRKHPVDVSIVKWRKAMVRMEWGQDVVERKPKEYKDSWKSEKVIVVGLMAIGEKEVPIIMKWWTILLLHQPVLRGNSLKQGYLLFCMIISLPQMVFIVHLRLPWHSLIVNIYYMITIMFHDFYI